MIKPGMTNTQVGMIGTASPMTPVTISPNPQQIRVIFFNYSILPPARFQAFIPARTPRM
jgi:hypothetical protein